MWRRNSYTSGWPMQLLTRLNEAFTYNPDTGELVWKTRPRHMFKNNQAWLSANTRFAGKLASSKHNDGYLTVRFEYKSFLVHRIAWCMTHGDFPKDGFEIDHINGDRSDNRLVNLRLVDRTGNSQNHALHCNNTSGQVGVYWGKRGSKWRAVITVNKKPIHLGCFDCFDDAVNARKQAEIGYGFHPNHGRYQ